MGSKLLILGNGFDLAHNLPTKYEHFLDFAKLAMKIYGYEKKEEELDIFKSDVNGWMGHDFLKKELIRLFGIRTVKINLDPNSDVEDQYVSVSDCRLDKFHECLVHNIWYRYINKLYCYKKMRGENWIDFETEISEIIKFIDERYNSINEPFLNIYREMKFNNSVEDKFSDFTYVLDAYWELNDSVGSFNTYKGASLASISSVRDRLYKDLEQLIVAFEIYLTEFVETIPIIDKLNVISEIKPDYVITFNYTKTYEKIYGIETPVCHIHGCCEKDRSEDDNNMVIGIDKYSMDNGNETDYFAIFKKYIQRIRKRNDVTYSVWSDKMRKNYQKYSDSIENGIDVESVVLNVHIPSYAFKIPKKAFSDVYTFGHSLDVTDKDVLERFLIPNYTRLHIFAVDRADEGKLITNLLSIAGESVVIEKSTISPPMIEFLPCKSK
ncbi:AbiH family protein [Butyrivibrio sp. MC2021]|uniref:AbiH family protein n=1 Tax=Butyrivibrio sp. MC2021 TaxID=1408306 RepID=UPI00047E558B|nr:AbiH family protein [Butyrivibrio sp. MC2021]